MLKTVFSNDPLKLIQYLKIYLSPLIHFQSTNFTMEHSAFLILCFLALSSAMNAWVDSVNGVDSFRNSTYDTPFKTLEYGIKVVRLVINI